MADITRPAHAGSTDVPWLTTQPASLWVITTVKSSVPWLAQQIETARWGVDYAKLINTLIAEPRVAFQLYGGYSPLSWMGTPGFDAYSFTLKSWTSVRSVKLLAPNTSNSVGTNGSLERLLGTWDAYTALKFSENNSLVYAIVFPDTRFDDRENVTGFCVIVPENLVEKFGALMERPAYLPQILRYVHRGFFTPTWWQLPNAIEGQRLYDTLMLQYQDLAY